MTLCGYPPEDLLFHKGLRRQVATAFERVRAETHGIAVMVGYPEYTEDAIYNAPAIVRDGEVLANYRKQELPNYAVFDEKRYFQHGRDTRIVEFQGIKVATLICEDIWEPGPARAAKAARTAARTSGTCTGSAAASRATTSARPPCSAAPATTTS